MGKLFSERVYQLVKKIPKGKVATYGQLAEVLGGRGLARAVGNALHQNPYKEVPCHRVVNHQGKVASRFGQGGWQEHKKRLVEEKVSFKDGKRVDLGKHQISGF